MQRRLTMSVLLIAIFMGGLDSTLLNTALPTMTRALVPSQPQLLWMVDGYPLAIAAVLVSCAKAVTAGDASPRAWPASPCSPARRPPPGWPRRR